jgi:hypothetical protein
MSSTPWPSPSTPGARTTRPRRRFWAHAALCLAIATCAWAPSPLMPAAANPELRADFGAHTASPDTRRLAQWVAGRNDHAGAPFVIVDKRQAQVFVFDGQARLRALSPVLLGQALGDASAPGVGAKAIADVLPHERTTPAGRFIAEPGHNARGEDVVWVDYDAAVSMHRVVTSNAAEQRLQRLASPSAADNRISYGCINVPAAFYDAHIRPTLARQHGVIYVLPDHLTLQQVFGL